MNPAQSMERMDGRRIPHAVKHADLHGDAQDLKHANKHGAELTPRRKMKRGTKRPMARNAVQSMKLGARQAVKRPEVQRRGACREAQAEAGSEAVQSRNLSLFPEAMDASCRSLSALWKLYFRKLALAEVKTLIMHYVKQILKQES